MQPKQIDVEPAQHHCVLAMLALPLFDKFLLDEPLEVVIEGTRAEFVRYILQALYKRFVAEAIGV